MTTTTKLSALALVLGVMGSGACSYDIANPNTPDIIGENPNRSEVAATANGILVATRADVGDWALDGGIFGREAYRFDGSDPRFVGELMQGPLDPGSNAFGGDHWAEEYTAIRTANDLLKVIGTASALSPAEQSATIGFAHTLQAYNFLIILDAHLQDSIPIDVGTDVTAPPAPFATNAQAWDRVISLLDGAVAELDAGGAAFPFTLPSGFAGFDTPPTFRQFNRALRARVAVYRGDFAGALSVLAESFINPAGPLDAGVYMDFSAGPGDFANPLALNPQTSENFGHPSLRTGAQLQPPTPSSPGGELDQRFLDKLVDRPPRSAGTPTQLTSDLGWIRYPSPNSPIPMIKNEELILLRAEAEINLNDLGPAVADLDIVRTVSGKLAPYAGTVDQPSLITELLYNKRYSLMFEGAHSWIDFRRYGRLSDLAGFDRGGAQPDILFTTLPIPTPEVLPRQ